MAKFCAGVLAGALACFGAVVYTQAREWQAEMEATLAALLYERQRERQRDEALRRMVEGHE